MTRDEQDWLAQAPSAWAWLKGAEAFIDPHGALTLASRALGPPRKGQKAVAVLAEVEARDELRRLQYMATIGPRVVVFWRSRWLSGRIAGERDQGQLTYD